MPHTPEPGPLLRALAPAPGAIEPLSLERIETAAGELPWTGDARELALRLAYAVGDASILADFACSPGAIAAGIRALRGGALLVTDVRMVATGIDAARAARLGVHVLPAIAQPGLEAEARARGITQSAQAMLALGSRLDGAVVAIGNAPTALLALLDLVDAGVARPALILGFPVGYVAAAESKEELLRRDIPYVALRGRRGGTPMAVAAANTLLRLATAGLAASPSASAPPLPVGGNGAGGEVPTIHVVGIGDDGLAGLGDRARAIIEGARTLYGGARHLELVRAAGVQPVRTVDLGARFVEAVEELASGACGHGAVVLASGDPMLYGIGATLARRLGARGVGSARLDVPRVDVPRLEILAHPSSVALAFAAIGEPAQDAVVLSALARPLRPVLAEAMATQRFAVLLDRGHDAAAIARALLDAGMEDATAAVCEHLGGPAQRIERGTLSAIAAGAYAALSLLVVLRDARAVEGYRRTAIPEGEFAHRAGQITKAEVRALAVAALALRPTDVLWDVGAGSGSVGIEAALSLPRGAVYAVDRDAEAIALLEANRVRFRTPQVEAVLGAAPAALGVLPEPDAVFLGGGGDALPAIVEVAMARLRPGGRLVATLATIERVPPLLSQLGAWSPSLRQVSIAHGVPLASGTRLAPANPVFLVAATKP